MAQDGNQTEKEIHIEEPKITETEVNIEEPTTTTTTTKRKFRQAKNHKHKTKMDTMVLNAGSCITLCCEFV